MMQLHVAKGPNGSEHFVEYGKVKHNVWHAVDGHGRGRWGTRAEIMADIDYFRSWGVLPKSKASLS